MAQEQCLQLKMSFYYIMTLKFIFSRGAGKPLEGGGYSLSHSPLGKTLQSEHRCGPLDALVCLESILTIEKQNMKLFPYQIYHMWGINESNGEIFSVAIYKGLRFGFYYLLLSLSLLVNSLVNY